VLKKRRGKIMKRFLLQTIYYDFDEVFSEIVTEYRIVHFVNMLDCNDGIKDYKVFDVSEFGKFKQLHYCGWKPGCLIEFVDDDGNIVISGYGDDH
jgi:hypothetical protein